VEAESLGLQLLDGELHAAVNTSDSLWVVEGDDTGDSKVRTRNVVAITLAKSVAALWPRLFASEAPEEPRLLDGVQKKDPLTK
jgi:hypothetical protein